MNRRHFLKSSATALGVTSAAALTMPAPASAAPGLGAPPITLKKNDVILFQGDSITDAGRSRPDAGTPNNAAALGKGYAWLATAQLLTDRPELNLQVYNRGISGHKVPQLTARWGTDCIDLKPNVLSILIGVNDIWHGLNGQYDGTPATYETGYLTLIEETLKALPDVKLIICEPFVLRCGAVKDNWFPTFDAYRAAAKKVADTFNAPFVPFQSIFDRASKVASPETWAGDGVHPSGTGASLMAHNWLKAVS